MTVQDSRRTIRGAGGGKSGGGASAAAPVEAPDSLRSKQFARVLDLLSEGEIGGLVDGLQSIFLDDTPLANPDGSYNFSGITISTNHGTQAQPYFPGFPAIENEVAVGTLITESAPVTRTITNVNVNKVRITLGVPQLTTQNTTTGDLTGAAVELQVDQQANGGGFQPRFGNTISGKTTTRYQRTIEMDLTGSPPWDVRVQRLTADSGSVSLVDKVFWDSYTEIIDSKLSYPNSAYVGVEVDAAQFNAVPRRGYEIYGIKIQVPSNYDPATRVYTGTWDGTFTVAWSDNPAWVFYDLLTNTRYGLGAFISASQVDKWALFSIGQYCDELVPDGFGGFEPRFTCNLYLQTRAEAFRVISNIASIFRGMAYWGAGAVVPVADMPSDAVALFAKANIVGGQFSYQGSARSTRHTVALVTWNDPADAYRQKVEYVEDLDGIDRYGVIETEIVAFGCSSRGQAHRLGRWLLYSERLETETVTFRTGLDGILVSPGNVIQTQDAARAGKRFGGRVLSGATTNSVPVDGAVTIESGKTYTLSIITPTGTVASAPVTNAPGSVSTFTLSPALSAAPQPNAIWVLAASDLVPETWRVMSVTEVEKTQLEVVALKHDANKYLAVEQNIFLEPLPTTSLTSRPGGVTNLMATESLFLAGPGVVNNRVTLSWSGTTGRYRVSYRSALTNWIALPETPSQTIEIDGLTPDTYTFNVVQVNAIGIAGPVNSLLQAIYGKTTAPADITGLSVIASSGLALVNWTLHPDLDVKVGGLIEIRHEAVSSGAVWNNGVLLKSFDGNSVSGVVPLVTGTYMAKAIDSTGNYSGSAATFVVTEGMVTGFTTVGTQTEAPTFGGTKVNCTVAGSTLRLSGGTLWDSLSGNVDTFPDIDSAGGQATAGTYTFGPLDLTTVAVRRFEADIAMSAFDNSDNWDARLGLIDDWDGLVDGGNVAINDASVVLNARLTDDNPAGSPTWSVYRPFHVADFNCRAAQFRLDLAVDTPAHNLQVSTLTIHAKVPA